MALAALSQNEEHSPLSPGEPLEADQTMVCQAENQGGNENKKDDTLEGETGYRRMMRMVELVRRDKDKAEVSNASLKKARSLLTKKRQRDNNN